MSCPFFACFKLHGVGRHASKPVKSAAHSMAVAWATGAAVRCRYGAREVRRDGWTRAGRTLDTHGRHDRGHW
jgi:hypothetical protein